jgi:hypothetical protein
MTGSVSLKLVELSIIHQKKICPDAKVRYETLYNFIPSHTVAIQVKKNTCLTSGSSVHGSLVDCIPSRSVSGSGKLNLKLYPARTNIGPDSVIALLFEAGL